MGCFLLVTQEDYQQIERLQRTARSTIWSSVHFIHKADDKVYVQVTDSPEYSLKQIARAIRTMFPETKVARKYHSHHIIPAFTGKDDAKYRDFFNKHNINVNEYTIPAEPGIHWGVIHKGRGGGALNEYWKHVIDTYGPSLTRGDIVRIAGQTVNPFGGIDVRPHRKHGL